eukprot:CCRYP_017001-RD/>CCRYP_017001-RD protein AED:0.48 eAED:1.00 QI:0/0/0/1/0/0/2/0/108
MLTTFNVGVPHHDFFDLLGRQIGKACAMDKISQHDEIFFCNVNLEPILTISFRIVRTRKVEGYHGLGSSAAPHANKEVGDPMISLMAAKPGVPYDALGLGRLDEDPVK